MAPNWPELDESSKLLDDNFIVFAGNFAKEASVYAKLDMGIAKRWSVYVKLDKHFAKLDSVYAKRYMVIG